MSNINWKKQSEESVRVGFKWVTKKNFLLPDGRIDEFTTWHKTGTESVAVVAITADHKVVVAKQYRPGPEKILYELPGGGTEPHESRENAARRELCEETGYVSDKPLVPIGQNCSDAYTNNTNYFFLATDCYKDGEPQLDANEFIEILELTVEELTQYATSGQMSDGVAVLCAYDKLKGTA